MKPQELKDKTKQFGIDVIRFSSGLPRNMSVYVMIKQLIRSATSTGANYRAACRARSRMEFIAKLGIVEEEADESIYWMELLVESGFVPYDKVSHLLKEADEILSIIVSSIKTARLHSFQSPIRNPKSAIDPSPNS